jgi:phenylalanyl-tRNA synthetase alpha chain
MLERLKGGSRVETNPILSPHEASILRAFQTAGQLLWLEEIVRQSGLELAQARSAVERLKLKGALDQVSERSEVRVSLSEAGRDALEKKIPELRLVETLQESGRVPIPELQRRDDLPPSEAGAAFGALKTRGLLAVEQGLARLAEGADLSELFARQDFLAKAAGGPLPLETLSPAERAWLDDRRMKAFFQVKEEKARQYRLTETGMGLRAGASAAQDEISRLTPAMLKDGSWQDKRFRRYSIGLPPRLVAGYRNPYRRFLDQTKQTLLALGFDEMRGSLVENEFWNMDALFMPQFHPARDIHDVYYIEEPARAKEIPEPYLSNVAAAHEGRSPVGSRGWGYLFDQDRARRLILRSQGTALSARQLAAQFGAKPNIPGKYFSMARCFRYDSIDATHAPDFIQIEGIVLSETVTFRHLLGMLEMFARVVAQAKEVRMVPDYFPFTEPSVQVHMKHPALGWIELGGAGLFRPELTAALGVSVPVIAWGLGLDRMAMVALGKNDIRHLFTNNLPRGLADNRGF